MERNPLDSDALGASAAGDRPVIDPPRRSETLVPFFAVGVVAATALAAALIAARPDPPAPVLEQAEAASSTPREVVKAPPLATKVPTSTTEGATPARAATNAMGGAPACRNCGVVQMVVAVHDYAQPRPTGYQMHIRMDDGSTRTVQQRGALPAGSRVQVEGESVRVLSQRSGQG